MGHKKTTSYTQAIFQAKDLMFDGLEVAKPDDPLFRTLAAEDYMEAKRTIRQYFKEILEVTQPGV